MRCGGAAIWASFLLSAGLLLPEAPLSCHAERFLEPYESDDGTSYDPQNPMVTHWPDEQGMRKRLGEYAKEKLGHRYHYKPAPYYYSPDEYRRSDGEDRADGFNMSDPATEVPRMRRDAGIFSGPASLAVLSGVIGMTTKAVSDITAFHPVPSDGGCKWFGTSPFCNYHCPPEFDYIRSHNGRCSSFWFASSCIPDDSYGEPCSTVLGSYLKKRFCCKSDPNECTWSGRWMGANTAHNAYCRYDNSVGRCGELTCSINHFDKKAIGRSLIGGERCDELHLFNSTGFATCGFIAWSDAEGNLLNSWYKTSG